MKRLLNTLYITQPDVYLSLDGDNILLMKEQEKLGRLPLHNLESIVSFGYTGASPALMGYCADRNISITFLTMSGRFLARVIGQSKGNVVLRKKQYLVSENEGLSAKVARNFIVGKIFNHKWMIERMTRDYPMRIDVDQFKHISRQLSSILLEVRSCEDLERLRGLEGQAAVSYNKVMGQMILQQTDDFYFHSRSRRPPLDNVNAMLSLAYTLLANDMAAALEAVGLDAYVGFLHRDRPGRASMALDVMEELRGVYADKFVLTLINKKMVNKDDFFKKENGAVLMTDDARKKFLDAWQKKKQEKIIHPYLGEKISWGLVPHAQALLLARYLRNDLDEYPPFLWK
ncbi:CRISPR-associated protein Cas4/endonuclease Cas1 fusion [Paenibacillus larvae subsp. larvae]|uniref:CRISPR-associated endonuclease Cas1 n=3 Tax=Paenibacillus larvae TaxID=1464 RepID=A0A2L1UE60_9BACL|nr:type I-C CRISPR-associated endonuclease Cas1c [Paenibacillus larvae]AQT83284.1 subtype I-C CRISPR-associated endonuclease Cas1 [Paenibacillus larvae subsp. pulvifaciens]AQZ48403.1 subtype I-C CRISPR-associated endonuclease Cas1 [Paenibacillus larvae subsp. pulvifaciens]AVF26404.1 CRISPR-associated protein Cas4/endonuclease Cas1 fusion [Paenibacillus larvae subsp. larvae]AVF31181.1 CRISPR-associated protein Cas4/endonuclease Cas1 fusion [Paenibacillus larvae subsp. larvae]MBH0344369.1 CRISPR